jgi:hypothetical protein
MKIPVLGSRFSYFRFMEQGDQNLQVKAEAPRGLYALGAPQA